MYVKKNKKENLNINAFQSQFCNTLIVGLGNPGYNWTRHNVGSDMLNLIVKSNVHKQVAENLYLVFFKGFAAFVYLSPDVMNISGKNVNSMMKKLNCKNLIVAVDDLDTKIGVIKKSVGVSSGGHNGIKSIIEYLGHNHFWKIKIGIGRPDNKEDVSRFVLEKFSENEREIIINTQKDIIIVLEEIWTLFLTQNPQKE